jgi:DNA-binding CsgD family transcriptional regulator
MKMKHFAALCLFLSLSCLNAVMAKTKSDFWKDVYPSADEVNSLLEQNKAYGYAPERKSQINYLYALARKHPDKPAILWRAQYWDARFGNDKTIVLLKKALSEIDKDNYLYDYMRVNDLLTVKLLKRGNDVVKLYKAYSSQLKYYTDIDDYVSQGEIYAGIGSLMYNLNSPTQALGNYRKAEDMFLKGGATMQALKAKLGICNSLYWVGNKKTTALMLANLERRQEVRRDTAFRLNVLLSLTFQMEVKSPYYSYYIKRLLNMAKSFGDTTLYKRSGINIGSYYYEHKQYDRSIALYKDALKNAIQQHNNGDVILCLRALGMNYAKKGDMKTAVDYFMHKEEYEDTVANVNQDNQVKNMETLFMIKEYENKIKSERELSKMYTTRVGLILTVIILLLGIICYVLWSKRKEERVRKLLKEAENRELQTKLTNEELLNKQQQLEIELKNRSLTIESLRRQEKENALKSLNKHILDANERHEVPNSVAFQVDNQVKQYTGDDNDWETFRKSFEEIYSGFLTNLSNQFPSLSEQEKRLCAFIRIGMDNRQIAKMLNIQYDSMYKSRYRLRRKLGIEKEDSLEEMLRDL